MVVGYIQKCNISNLIRRVFLPVFFVLYKEWTVWIAWDDFIKLFTWVIHVKFSSKWTPKIFVLFSPSTGSLLCTNLHLSGWLRLCLLLSCSDENSWYFVLSSLKTKLFLNLTQFVGLILTFQYNFVGFLTCNVGITWYHLPIVKNYSWCCLLCLQYIS